MSYLQKLHTYNEIASITIKIMHVVNLVWIHFQHNTMHVHMYIIYIYIPAKVDDMHFFLHVCTAAIHS